MSFHVISAVGNHDYSSQSDPVASYWGCICRLVCFWRHMQWCYSKDTHLLLPGACCLMLFQPSATKIRQHHLNLFPSGCFSITSSWCSPSSTFLIVSAAKVPYRDCKASTCSLASGETSCLPSWTSSFQICQIVCKVIRFVFLVRICGVWIVSASKAGN